MNKATFLIFSLFLPSLRCDESIIDTTSYLARSSSRRIVEDCFSQQVQDSSRSCDNAVKRALTLFSNNLLSERAELYFHTIEKGRSSKLGLSSKTEDFGTADKLFQIGIDRFATDQSEDAISHLTEALRLNKLHSDAKMLLALSLFRLASKAQHSGNIIEAFNLYDQCLQVDEQFFGARLNLAALHHQYGRIRDAVVEYEILLDMMRVAIAVKEKESDQMIKPYWTPEYNMAVLNYAVALMQEGNHEPSYAAVDTLIQQLESALQEDSSCFTRVGDWAISKPSNVSDASATSATPGIPLPNQKCVQWYDSVLTGRSHRANIQRSSCDWRQAVHTATIILYGCI